MYIQQFSNLKQKSVLDVGCGGGILTESMARLGANVTGIDMAKDVLTVAKLHLIESNFTINYYETTAEELAKQTPENFDIVTCMELLEHVSDPASIVNACAKLVKPGGQVFFSTLNRNLKSYLYAILGAEYLLKMLPIGTHDYDKFIRPSEMASWARENQLLLKDYTGINYNLFNREYFLSKNIDVNYLACFQKND